ncbi:MAG: rRNA maturation RNase YbeY [Bdellovibrionales bacterium]
MTPLIINQTQCRTPRSYLLSALKFFKNRLPKKHRSQLGKELTVLFVDAKEAQRLNKQFRGKNYATDVLSFESVEGELGELVLCPAVIQEQAREHGFSYRDELVYLVLHGVLHLLGYDHETCENEARKMYDIQDKLFDEFLTKKNS